MMGSALCTWQCPSGALQWLRHASTDAGSTDAANAADPQAAEEQEPAPYVKRRNQKKRMALRLLQRQVVLYRLCEHECTGPTQVTHEMRIMQTRAAYERKHAKQVATWRWKAQAWAEYRAKKAAAEQQAQTDAADA